MLPLSELQKGKSKQAQRPPASSRFATSPALRHPLGDTTGLSLPAGWHSPGAAAWSHG